MASPGNLYENAKEAAEFVRRHYEISTQTALILGTGLETAIADLKILCEIPYASIPHFRVSTVKSHKGALLIGNWNGKEILVLSGRLHYYEGYSMKEVTFPIRVLQMLGIEQIIITNASGGIDASYENGDIVVVEDHINMMPENPLRGENDERLGDRFPDMSEPYDKRLRNLALELGSAHQLPVKSGVYVGWPGPNLETPAEYRFLNMIGATVVGMSTVPEVIVARHAGIRVLVFSVVSNVCFPPDRIKETSLEDVIATVRAASAHMRQLLSLLISRI